LIKNLLDHSNNFVNILITLNQPGLCPFVVLGGDMWLEATLLWLLLVRAILNLLCNQGSISSMFYKQFLRMQIPNVQKDS